MYLNLYLNIALGLLAGLFWLYLALKLSWITVLIILVFLLAVAPLHIAKIRRQKHALLHFNETVLYIESMLQAFAREGKIEAALANIAAAMKDGELKEVLSNAYNHIQITYDEAEVLENSLAIIEKAYSCKRVAALHRLLLHAELFGGDTRDAVELMREDCKRWQLRISVAIEERKKAFREILLSVVASVAICACILHLPIMGVDVSAYPIVQALSVVLLVTDDLIILLGQKYLCQDWINLDGFEDSYESKQKIKRYRSYDEKKARKLSYILGAITGALALVSLVFKLYWIFALLLLVLLVVVNQHRIGHFLTGRAVVKELKSAFPSWLIDLALLMQSENVFNAIQKSRAQAPGILAEDLRRLENELAIDPESSRPYHNFLREFELPQVTGAMSMLYSLSMGNSANGKRELIDLVNGNYRLQDDAERVRLRDKAAGMYLLFLAPVLTASLKLVVDMAVFMISFVGQGIHV